MTQDQLKTCMELSAADWHPLLLPHAEDTPIPGLLLFVKTDQKQLLLVLPDGSTVDLRALHAKAEDLIRNWGKGSSTPAFVGDWRRLTRLANVLNGLPEIMGEPE